MRIINKNTLIIVGILAGLAFVLQFSFASDIYAQSIRCHSNADCGSDRFITGTQTCRGNDIYQNYQTYTCVNPGTTSSTCVSSRIYTFVHSCGSNQCQRGHCVSGVPSSPPPPPPPAPPSQYNPNAYLQCFGNSVYWYDSNDRRHSLYQSCGSHQECVNNSCANIAPSVSYVLHSAKGCFNNSAYWYDSLGKRQTIIQNCSLTGQTCQNGQCAGTVITSTVTPPPPPPVEIIPEDKKEGELVIYLFAKMDNDPLNWKKVISAGNGETINLLAIIKNNSPFPIDSAIMRINLTESLVYAGNMKVNESFHEGNVINGVNVGLIPSGESKAIVFDSTVQHRSGSANFSVLSSVSMNNVIYDTDQINVNIISGVSTAAISQSGIFGFTGQWYIWLIIIVVTIALFIIIFRRLSLSE